MGPDFTAEGCKSRYRRLKDSNPWLQKVARHTPLLRKKAQFSEEQIKQFQEHLDSQILIGAEKHVSAEIIAKVREDRGKGASYLKIAEDHDLTKSCVKFYCGRASYLGHR